MHGFEKGHLNSYYDFAGEFQGESSCHIEQVRTQGTQLNIWDILILNNDFLCYLKFKFG